MLPAVEIITNKNSKYAIVGPYDYISNAIKRSGFEEGVKQSSNEILKNIKDGIVLDIGANMGSYSVPIAVAHPHLQVHSFEPQRIIFYQLCTNIILNSLDNVFAYNVALSNSKWTKSLQVPDYKNEYNIGAFSIDDEVRKEGYLVTTQGNLEQINAICLDTLRLKNVRLIKIDVEGHELEVLQGADKTIRESNYPTIIFEAWDTKFTDKKESLFKYLTAMDYTITMIDGNSNYLAIHHKEKNDT